MFEQIRQDIHCSGLLGRTSLRRQVSILSEINAFLLFRPSRPDFIETRSRHTRSSLMNQYCSGLLGRTSLRQERLNLGLRDAHLHCSGLLGRTSLRQHAARRKQTPLRALFRPSRPDFIETSIKYTGEEYNSSLFRPSRPDFIETSRVAVPH